MQKPIKPLAPTQEDQRRFTHSGLRHRLITGNWQDDLEDELARHLPADRREAWGAADMSSNPFEQITRQLSVLYHETPTVTNLNGNIDALVAREGLVTQAGLWQLMQRGQQLILGLNEAVVRIDVNPYDPDSEIKAPAIQYRIVTGKQVPRELLERLYFRLNS